MLFNAVVIDKFYDIFCLLCNGSIVVVFEALEFAFYHNFKYDKTLLFVDYYAEQAALIKITDLRRYMVQD